MKISVAAILALFVASYAFADAAPAPMFNVKINSFTHLGDVNSTLGELCGTVTVTDTETMPKVANIIPVTVTADPNTGNPGQYTVLVDRTGNFCTLINTYTGTAQAEAWLPGGAHIATEVARVGTGRR